MSACCPASYAIVVAGHGSRDSSGVEEFEQVVALMRQKAADRPIYHGYLEFAKPSIEAAVYQAVTDGNKTVVVVPALLAAATHAKNDMPAQLNNLRNKFPQCELHFGAALDLHPLLLQLCRARIVAAEGQSGQIIKRADTCLVVVGRGTTDPDANGDVYKLARMLEEGMGFGASFICYSGTAKPLVADGLKMAAKLGFRRLTIVPYMLFDGVLVKRIYGAAQALASRLPAVDVLTTGYLGACEPVAEVFLERADEGVNGRAHMNCSLCKYRLNIVGFEDEVGAPQIDTRRATALVVPAAAKFAPYEPHPIEKQSFEIIDKARSWTSFSGPELTVAQRLAHTSGCLDAADDLFFSPGAAAAGMKALLRCRRVVCDVTMVASGLKRELSEKLKVATWCGVHDQESFLISKEYGITRSAAGIRRAWQKWGNDLILAIGDAPTAVAEAVRLVTEHNWRPQLIIGLPVGFVGTLEAKEELKRCLMVPRITNAGTRGGSPWAASVVNALMIETLNELAATSLMPGDWQLATEGSLKMVRE